MGAQRGSGMPPMPPELRRTQSVRMMLRPGQFADLEVVAEAWGVPVGTAAWAVLTEVIAGWRGVQPDLGRDGVKIAAASHALQMCGIEHVEPPE